MFAGLFRKPEGNFTASSTPLETQKQRQVESLQKNNPSVVELKKYEEYLLAVATNAGTLSLNIYLPNLFPQTKPVITVSPPVCHPWVNNLQQITGCPELLNFSMHSDLGKIILHIAEEFHQHPPGTIGIPQTTVYPQHPLNGTSTLSSSNLPNAVYTPGSGKSILHLPFSQGTDFQFEPNVLPSNFPELKGISVTELQQLKDDKDKLQEFVNKLTVIEKLTREKEQLSLVIEELARQNLSKQRLLEENKKKLLELVDTISSLRKEFDDYSHRHQNLSEQYCPTSIQENLKFAALQAEEESEKIAENFLEGKIEIEEFLSNFMNTRALSHCRRAKEEKLHQQLMELKKSGF